MLAFTGYRLWHDYRPVADGVDRVFLDAGLRRVASARDLHRAAATAAIPTAIAAAVLGALSARRAWAVATGLALTAAVTAAFAGGGDLAWDQVALRAVTTDLPVGGMRIVFEPGVLFVLVGANEVSTSTFQRWLITHVGVLPGVAVVAGAGLALLLSRRSARISPEEGEQPVLR